MKEEGLMKKKGGNPSGQAVIEYVMLMAITVGSIVFLVRNLGKSMDKSVPRMGGKMEQQLRAGAAPPSIWRK